MKRILGVDVGQKRIGLALSDPMGITAGGLGVLERTGTEQAVKAIADLCIKHEVQTIVVGLPLTLRGTKGPQAQRVQSFADKLQAAAGVPIAMVDERFTTAQGERALMQTGAKRKQRDAVIDQVAAQLILQSYLDQQRPLLDRQRSFDAEK